MTKQMANEASPTTRFRHFLADGEEIALRESRGERVRRRDDLLPMLDTPALLATRPSIKFAFLFLPSVPSRSQKGKLRGEGRTCEPNRVNAFRDPQPEFASGLF